MTRAFVVLSLSVAAASAASAASAGDLPERRAIDQRSRLHGIGRSTVRLASRGPRAGTAAVTQSLSAKLPSAGEWRVRLQGDGSAGELVRPSARRRRPVAPEERLSDEALVARARAFVEATLAAPLSIKEGDVYALKTAHQMTRAMSKLGERAPERLVSSRVTFGRTLDGLPVLGPGSKIFVELSPDGEVIGARYDWARLTLKAERQATVPLGTVLRRGTGHTRLRGLRLDDYTRVECGYYDAGADADPQAPVQAACLLQQVRTDGAGTTAVEELVPAGLDVRPDKSWALSGRASAAPTVGVPPSEQ